VEEHTCEYALTGEISWSPDGEHLAMSGLVNGNLDILIHNLANNNIVPFTSNQATDQSPSWASDGKWIAFSSNRTGQDEIWVKSLTAGTLRRLTHSGGNTHPSFSPGGDRIAWINKNKGVQIMSLHTGEVLTPAIPRMVDFAPAWSPDEKYLAVTSNDWGSWDIYIMRSDGRRRLLLTKQEGRQSMPAWQPDGKALLVVSDHSTENDLWILSGLETYLARLSSPQDE
jgi:TolB protein